ncbi:MAG: glycosyltransferase family 2 protein [Myxococcota bacterium]
MQTAILIPVLNEEQALPKVLSELPPGHRVVVCDNGSTDRSADIARAHGADVVSEPARGYGGACLAGIAHLRAHPPDAVVIMDGDASCDPRDLPVLLEPIAENRADLVVGERLTLGEPGALTPQQRAGNAVATACIAARAGRRWRDMGPFRAIRWGALLDLGMVDRTWGWNVEMQMKAARQGLRCLEVPVHNRPRIGKSKISGTVQGVVRAGGKILWACWRYA